ncbi:hypothetical protein L1887_63491 [Cichorium endivia]|nr:hypothetical protein L1887_63491 [Cichorium endivia]
MRGNAGRASPPDSRHHTIASRVSVQYWLNARGDLEPSISLSQRLGMGEVHNTRAVSCTANKPLCRTITISQKCHAVHQPAIQWQHASAACHDMIVWVTRSPRAGEGCRFPTSAGLCGDCKDPTDFGSWAASFDEEPCWHLELCASNNVWQNIG